MNVAIAIAEALTYLHERNVVHGSMSSSNVLIDEHGDVHVVDYGLMHIATTLGKVEQCAISSTRVGYEQFFRFRIQVPKSC